MKILYCTATLLVASFFTFAQETPAPAATKVLIAMEQTEFKKKLVNAMKPLLEKQGMMVTLIENHEKEIASIKAADYDLVFITNSGVWSKVRPWITSWIDANKADSAKMLLHTTKQLKWQEEVYVDAVSSASSNKLVPKLAEEYVAKLAGKR